MPRYRRVLRRPEAVVSDLRQTDSAAQGGVTVESLTPPPTSEPELTESTVAPEASPAKTKSTGPRKASTRRKK